MCKHVALNFFLGLLENGSLLSICENKTEGVQLNVYDVTHEIGL